MATIVVIDENELVVEPWEENTEIVTSWNETVIETSEDES